MEVLNLNYTKVMLQFYQDKVTVKLIDSGPHLLNYKYLNQLQFHRDMIL